MIPESDVRRKARAYWRADGIPILLGGLVYLFVVGAFRLLWSTTIHISDFKGNWFWESFVGPFIWFAIATLPFWLVAFTIWMMGNWEDIVEWFKVRVTYPRTGYVTPPSYWLGESVPTSSSNEELLNNAHKNLLYRILTILGGFWFWLVVQFWKGHPPEFVMLIILLVVRCLRYGLYPESDVGANNTGVRLKALSKSVLNSFWLWVWLGSFLSHLTSGLPQWIKWVLPICLTVLAIRFLLEVTSLRLLGGIFICAVLCSFLFYKDTTVSTTLALCVPGLYAFFIGSFRLIRYLRANPVPQT